MVPVSEAESETRKTIPAHKLVLAISSPVFYAMFYGQLAEAKDCVELPDCEYDSMLEFLRYLYSDKANLTLSNVMHVLYLADKYMVPSLAGTSDARYICTISMYKRVTPSQPSQQRGRLDLSRFVTHDALTHKVILTQGEWRNVVRVQFLFLLKV